MNHAVIAPYPSPAYKLEMANTVSVSKHSFHVFCSWSTSHTPPPILQQCVCVQSAQLCVPVCGGVWVCVCGGGGRGGVEFCFRAASKPQNQIEERRNWKSLLVFFFFPRTDGLHWWMSWRASWTRLGLPCCGSCCCWSFWSLNSEQAAEWEMSIFN